MPLQVAPIPAFQFRVGFPFRMREPRVTPSAFSLNVVGQGVIFSEFYCDPVNGNNMNGGSDQSASPSYSSVNGNWNGTSTFIPSDSSNPYYSVVPGQFAHVFVDGSATPVYIARVISADNATNGQIILSTTAKAGTVPTSSATARSIRVGGAWKGPNAAVGWPINTNMSAATNVAARQVRINFKNNGVYSITAAIANNNSSVILQGYSVNPGDEGKANLDGGSNAIHLITGGGTFYDFIFSNNGSTGANNAIFNATGLTVFRCVFHDIRGAAIVFAVGLEYFWVIECEFYNCNTSNSSTTGIVTAGSAANSTTIVLNSYFHDCPVSNGNGVCLQGQNSAMVVMGCIFDTMGGSAVITTSSAGGNLQIVLANCSFYNITGSAFANSGSVSSAAALWGWNNIICKTTQYGFDGTIDARLTGFMYNTVWGAGTMACRSGKVNFPYAFQTFNDILLPQDVSPWVSPDTGNFTLSSGLAIGTGRGAITQTGSKLGARGFPDVGATQAPAGFNPSTLTLLDGFVGQPYYDYFEYSTSVTVGLQSGALPPGLILGQPTASSWLVSGTPTTAGTYVATLSLVSTGGTSSVVVTITIANDPNEGIGGMFLD